MDVDESRQHRFSRRLDHVRLDQRFFRPAPLVHRLDLAFAHQQRSRLDHAAVADEDLRVADQKHVAALQLAPQHPVLHDLLARPELIHAERDERQEHGRHPQLCRRLQFFVLFPPEQPRRDEQRNRERDDERDCGLPVRGEGLVLGEDALHAADEVRRGQELRHHLPPVRQGGRGKRGAAQHEHRHVEHLHQHVALGRRVRHGRDDQTDAAERQRADRQEEQQRERPIRHRHPVQHARERHGDRDRRQVEQETRGERRAENRQRRDRRHLVAPQDVLLALLDRADPRAEEAVAQDADHEHVGDDHRDDRPAALRVQHHREEEEEDQRKHVVEEQHLLVAEREAQLVGREREVRAHSRRLFPVSSMKTSSSEGRRSCTSASSTPI